MKKNLIARLFNSIAIVGNEYARGRNPITREINPIARGVNYITRGKNPITIGKIHVQVLLTPLCLELGRLLLQYCELDQKYALTLEELMPGRSEPEG